MAVEKAHDWIVVGGGIAGAAAAYELANQGLSVLLLESQSNLQATSRGYGGVPYWMGSTPLIRQLCEAGRTRHQVLPGELGADTQFRELDLLLTVAANQDLNQALESYANCSQVPAPIGVPEACDREPLINPEAIAGALLVRHGHVNPEQLVEAYVQAFTRLGGTFRLAKVTQVKDGPTPQVFTTEGPLDCDNILVCAGGLSRHLLRVSGRSLQQYFTHAEVLITPPLPVSLRTMIMPAASQRAVLESQATQPQNEEQWRQEARPIGSPIVDPGAIQFLDGRLYIGQISRAIADPFAPIDLQQSEATLRQRIGALLPALEAIPGVCHHCLVAFSSDGLPLVGPVAEASHIQVFSGFAGPFAIVPPLAQRFAAHVTGHPDAIITALSPRRVSLTAEG